MPVHGQPSRIVSLSVRYLSKPNSERCRDAKHARQRRPVNPLLQRVSPSIAPIQPTYSEITHTGGRTVRHRKPLSVLVKLFNPSDIDSCSKDLAGARPESAPSARWTEWALRRYLAAIHRHRYRNPQLENPSRNSYVLRPPDRTAPAGREGRPRRGCMGLAPD